MREIVATRAPVLFVAGLGRSGSTLVERSLGQLSGVRPVGEVVHLWERGVKRNERCGCGEHFRECEFWTQVGLAAFGGWDQVDVDGVLRLQQRVDRTRYAPPMAVGLGTPAFRHALAEFRRWLAPLYGAMRSVSGASMLVDSSKNPSYAYVLRGVSSVSLRVLHVVRDPRAVAYSWAKVVPRPDAPDSQMARWSPTRTAVQWETQNLMVELLGRVGTSVHAVRYEDFVESPSECLRRVAAFADIDIDPTVDSMLKRHRVRLSTDHTVSGNPLRFEQGEVQIRADDRWSKELPRHDRRRVSSLTVVGRHRYGYPASRRTG